MTKSDAFPVFAKGGFNMRNEEPIGFAKSRAEANRIIKANMPKIHGGANGGSYIISTNGVEFLKDEQGCYFVAKRKIVES